MATVFHLRTYRRLPVQGLGTVLYAGLDGEGRGHLWNLSVTGCRITSSQLAPGAVLSILLELPNKRAVIVPRTRVVWCRGADHGLELMGTVAGDLERLQRFIQEIPFQLQRRLQDKRHRFTPLQIKVLADAVTNLNRFLIAWQTQAASKRKVVGL